MTLHELLTDEESGLESMAAYVRALDHKVDLLLKLAFLTEAGYDVGDPAALADRRVRHELEERLAQLAAAAQSAPANPLRILR